jgi:hypothetical protein
MRMSSLKMLAGLGLAAALSGCNPPAYPDCYRAPCPYPPVYQNSYAGYVPAYVTSPHSVLSFGEPPFDDPFAPYTQRSLTISPSAGNSQAANTVLQTATPWPPHSGNTKIPGNGSQMVRAVHDFEAGKRPPLVDAGGSAPGIQINNNSGGASGGGQ